MLPIELNSKIGIDNNIYDGAFFAIGTVHCNITSLLCALAVTRCVELRVASQKKTITNAWKMGPPVALKVTNHLPHYSTE